MTLYEQDPITHPLQDLYEQIDDLFSTGIERKCCKTMVLTAYLRGAKTVARAANKACESVLATPRNIPRP